ncbi:hypothetical protein KJ682_11635 [bacterium]|nr:hypothetical protein [bacterium]
MAYGQDIKLQAKALWITGAGTDQQIAQRLGIKRPETIGDWRRTEGWDIERQYVQKITEERVTQAVAETITEMNTRHLKEYQLLQSKGVQGLKDLAPKTAGEAMSLVDVGIRGERLVRGEPTEVREVRALMQANVQVLEIVVADVIKVLIDAGRMDKRLAQVFADEFARRVNEAPFRYAVEG